MDDSVDKQLADHLRQTLDGYQTPYQLGAWEAFDRVRQPAKRRLGVWYRYVAAASVLGGLLLAPLWLEDARLPSTTWPGSIASRSTPPDQSFARTKPSTTLPPLPVPASWEPVVTRHEHRTQNHPVHTDSPTTLPLGNFPLYPTPPIAWLVPTNKIEGLDLPEKSGFDRSKTTNQPVAIVLNEQTNPVAGKSGQAPTAPVVSGTAPTQTTQMSVAKALAMNKTATSDQPRERRRAVTWGLALAPQTAYIPNGRLSLTLGGGVVSDIALNRRFSVSTGLSVAQQRVGLAPPINQVMTTPGRQLTGTDARFVLIDLPLNLTYQVGKRTKPLFRVSAGLSSLAFLSQHYADTYQRYQTLVTQVIDGNGRPQIIQQTTQIEEVQTRPQTPSGGVYWGRLLNLSVGIERPLSRRMVIGLESYLKYPLGPLTRENLSVGSAGVSMRIGIR